MICLQDDTPSTLTPVFNFQNLTFEIVLKDRIKFSNSPHILYLRSSVQTAYKLHPLHTIVLKIIEIQTTLVLRFLTLQCT